jgi:nickel-dependent lactate racemase
MSARRIDLAYGKGCVSIDIPEENLGKVLRCRPWPPLLNLHTAIEDSLAHPIGAPPLAELARGRRDAVVVISDITRPAPNHLFLPPILRILEAAGIPREKTLILIATGMHRPNLGKELAELVGDEIASGYRIENHAGTDIDSHANLGVSEDGIPIQVDRRYIAADLKIVTGLIEPHLIAGYSGGRKGVLPGLCSLETMKVMHGYRMIQHPHAEVGRLDGNPFHLACLGIVRRIGVDFLLNVTLNEDRQVSGVYAGDLDLAHRAGVADLEHYVVDFVDEPVDIVVTCGGGYPLDQTLYQAIKGTVAAREILKPGGSIVFAASLAEGVGSPSFQQLLAQMTTAEEMLGRLEKVDYLQLDQWMLQDHCNVLLQARDVLLYSEHLSREWMDRSLVHPVSSMNEGLARAFTSQGNSARVAVLPQGPYVIAKAAEHVGV